MWGKKRVRRKLSRNAKKDLVKSCCCHKDTAGGEHSPVGVGWGGHCAAVGLWKILCYDIKKREAALGLRQDCWTEFVAERLDLWTLCSHRTTDGPPKCSRLLLVKEQSYRVWITYVCHLLRTVGDGIPP